MRMYSEARFHQIEESLQASSREYEGSETNAELARTLLITAERLASIHQGVEQHLGDVSPDQYQYQDVFFSKGVNAQFALFRLIKRYRYDAAFREIRYLLETYFVLRGLNRNRDRAADIYQDFKEELAELGNDDMEQALHEFRAVDRLFDVMREERNAAKEVWPDIQRIYNYFSNRSSHPVRMLGAGMDGEWNEELESQLLKWGLYLAYGLTTELFKTYQVTSASPMIKQQSQPIVRQFDVVLGKDVPEFLLDTY